MIICNALTKKSLRFASIMVFTLFAMTTPSHASPVTVSLNKDCGLDNRLWQVGTSSHNVRINPDRKTFTVDFPVGTKICAYINQDSYCSCWGYKFCEGPQPAICPTGGANNHLLVLIIGGCTTITDPKQPVSIPISCENF